MSVRVAIRPGCNGMGSCVRLAPAVFRMDATTGTARVLVEDATAHREAVLAAARSCPFVAVEVDGVPVDEPIEEVPVIACEPLAPEIVTLRLARAGFRFTPGQYVCLRLTDERGGFFRTYSVVSASAGVVTLCIRLVANGRAARVLTAINPGAIVGLSRAKGLFALQTPDRPKLFLTGGTGLAPVIPMCLAAPDAHKLVIIGARTPAALFWSERVAEIPNTRVIAIVQTPDGQWQGPVGTVVDPLAELDLNAWPEIYTCGSPGMVASVQRALSARGVGGERLFCDSFVPSGMAPPSTGSGTDRIADVGGTAAAPVLRDWGGPLRRLHLLASGPLSLLVLFYALSGFVANRADLFIAEGTADRRRLLPAEASLAPAEVAPVLAAMVGDGARVVRTLPGSDAGPEAAAGADPGAEILDSGGNQWRVTVDPATRRVRFIEHGVLPEGTALEPAAVARALAQRLSGAPDLEHAEAGADGVEVEFSSVWGTHQVKVAADRTWTATSIRQPVIASLVDLHRGKHTGSLQRLIVDVTALGLAFLTFSGVAMTLLIAAPRRRRQARILLGSSLVLLVLLLISR